MKLRWIVLGMAGAAAVMANCGGGDTNGSGGSAGGSGPGGSGPSSTSGLTGGGGPGGSGIGGFGVGGSTGTSAGGGTSTQTAAGGASGTGGSTATGGGSQTSTGGASGTGGAGGGGAQVLIQDVEDGTIATGATVSLSHVFVTSVRKSASASPNMDITLQEPQGTTKAGVTYPGFAGIAFHASPAEVATYSLTTLAIGDCVDISATVAEFHSNTELNTPTAFTKLAAAMCGTAPTPLDVDTAAAVHFADIATDAGGGTAGTSTELYENVLVKIHNVTVGATSATGFVVTPTGQAAMTPNLAISTFIIGPIATPGPTYVTVTGVLEQFDTFSLYPRSTADLQ